MAATAGRYGVFVPASQVGVDADGAATQERNSGRIAGLLLVMGLGVVCYSVALSASGETSRRRPTAAEMAAMVAEIPDWETVEAVEAVATQTIENCECTNNNTCATPYNSTELFSQFQCDLPANSTPCFDYAGVLRQENDTWSFCRNVTGADDCANVVCKHGGQCVDGDGSAECSCRPGWRGDTCEQVSVMNYAVTFVVDKTIFAFDPIKIRFMGANGDTSSQLLLTDDGMNEGDEVSFSIIARDVGVLSAVQMACRPGPRYELQVSDFQVAVGTSVYERDSIVVDGFPGTIFPMDLVPEPDR